MARETFTWPVDVGTGVEFEFQTSDMDFGEGYDISVGQGIDNERQTWSFSMFVDRRDPNSPGNEALAFLRRHKGWKTFDWVNPYGETIQVRCPSLSDDSNGATTFVMKGSFRQVFLP